MKWLFTLIIAYSSSSFLYAQENSKTSDGTTQLFVGGGIARNSVRISGSNSDLEMNIDHPKTSAPVFVVGSKFTVGKTNKSLIIVPAIRVHSINSTAKKDLTSGMATYHHTSTFKASPVISPTASLGYNIVRTPGFTWYVAGGLGFSFLVNGKEVQSNYYDPSNSELAADRKPRSLIAALNLQTGFDLGKNLGIWLYYQTPTNTTDNVQKKVQISTLQAGLCYYFKAKG